MNGKLMNTPNYDKQHYLFVRFVQLNNNFRKSQRIRIRDHVYETFSQSNIPSFPAAFNKIKSTRNRNITNIKHTFDLN